jgi:hypothetical protein
MNVAEQQVLDVEFIEPGSQNGNSGSMIRRPLPAGKYCAQGIAYLRGSA